MGCCQAFSAESLVRWLQRVNLFCVGLIIFSVLQCGRLERLTTFDEQIARTPEAVQWGLLQPLLQREAFEERRTLFANKTRGLLKGERHRAIAARLCVEEGVDVTADKEAGYALEGYVPYAFFLHLHDCLRSSIGFAGSESFFIFNPEHQIFDKKLSPAHTWLFKDFIQTTNPFAFVHNKSAEIAKATHIRSSWNPMRHPIDVPYGLTWPSFASFYKTEAFSTLDKPLAVVAGKYTSEWNSAKPINYIATRDRLEPILDTLLEHGYFVIYNRPNVLFAGDSEAQKVKEAHDFDLIHQKYWQDDVLILQDIEAALLPQDLDRDSLTIARNTLMLHIYASTSLFVSTQGGNAVIASLFPADNFLLHTRGYEDFGKDPAMPSEHAYVYPRWYAHGRSRIFAFAKFEDLIRNLRAYLRERAL